MSSRDVFQGRRGWIQEQVASGQFVQLDWSAQSPAEHARVVWPHDPVGV